MINITTKSKPQDKSKMCEIDHHILKLFDFKRRVGKGAYGIVWKAIDNRTEDIVAVKKIFEAFRNPTDAQRTFREIIFLNAFRSHPNIVKLHNVYRAVNNLDIYLVFEYMESDLHNIIKRVSVLKDVHKRYVMYQLINAIKYIHSGNVIHRDLKPSNILIDSKCRCKLADFGLARSVSNRDSNVDDMPSGPLLTDYVATRWYRAPEILVASKRYTKGIDMWSLGCILGEMLRGKPLFQGNNTVNQMERIVCALPVITNHDIEGVGADYGSGLLNTQISHESRTSLDEILGDIPDDAMDLVKSLLILNPLARLTAAQALEHPYVTRFRHTISENDLDVDIVPPFNDDTRFTVTQYRDKLYKLVEDVPLMRGHRSASSRTKRIDSSHRIIHNNEKNSHSKASIPSSQHLHRKESRERMPSGKQNTSQERLPIKKNSPQIKNVPAKTMISTLPSTNFVNVKPEVLPTTEKSIEVNPQRKPARKSNNYQILEAKSSTPTIKDVQTQNSQESNENVRSLIKKRVSNTKKLSNINQSQSLPKQEQQTKDQNILQQQLQQHLLKQQEFFYKQQKMINEQKVQQQQDMQVLDKNRHKSITQQQQQQQQQTQVQSIKIHKNSKHTINHESEFHLQRKITTQQHKPKWVHDTSRRGTDASPTTEFDENIQQRMNNALTESQVCKLRTQNVPRIHRETVHNNEKNVSNSRDHIRARDKRTKSAEYTINRHGIPTIAKDQPNNPCYEERLRRIEEAIKSYKDEVKCFAHDNLRFSKQKMEMTENSCDRMPPNESAKQRTIHVMKNNGKLQHKNNTFYNNKMVNRHFTYSPTSSSSRCSSESDVPETRTKSSFTNFPAVNTMNSCYQFLQRHKTKRPEMGSGASGDHISRPLEQEQVKNKQQKLQFKHSIKSLIKAHLQPTNMQQRQPEAPVNILSPPTGTPIHKSKSMMFANVNEYRYKKQQ